MDVKDEVAKAIEEYKRKQRAELVAKMAKMGRSRSPKKRRAVLQNIKKAQAAKRGKLIPAKRPHESRKNQARSG